MIKFKKNSIKLAGAALFLALSLGIGTTGAVIRHQMSLSNQIKTPTVNVTVEENIEGKPKNGVKQKEVSFKNTGTADVFLRMAYAEMWSYTDGTAAPVILPNRDSDAMAEISWDKEWNTHWYDGEDGWYYYRRVLKPDESTEPVTVSVTFPANYADARYAAADYELHFQTEAVQASDELAVSKSAAETVFKRNLLSYDGSYQIDNDDKWLAAKYRAALEWPDLGQKGGGN